MLAARNVVSWLAARAAPAMQAGLRRGVAVSISARCQSTACRRHVVATLRRHLHSNTRSSVGTRVQSGVLANTAVRAAEFSSTTGAAMDASQRTIGVWLLGTTGLIFGAVVLGGVTRLTESGLSMVKWHPIKGMRPPVSEEEWIEEFECYKQYPEYKYSNGMSLEDFKRIFYMEYAHRMWGRLIGVAFAVPAIAFWLRGRIRQQYKPVVLAMGGLLGFQGVLGWIMVKSGLDYDPEGKHVPRVSHYRLAAHLGSAFLLYIVTLWTGLSHILPERTFKETPRALFKLKRYAHMVGGLVFITALSGAFVAGLDAGLLYNEFPLMGGRWVPSDLLALSPTWTNFFDNPTTVQFDHRILGVTTGLSVLALWAKARKLPLHGRARLAINAMLGMVSVQVSLGIATLLYFVPTPLAATHQAGSLTLLTFAVWFMHELRRLKLNKMPK
ncbi:hypothetical protein PTSG_09569 [Salpingoeca rosetta]|uniref:Cytochrome c oxidase assembly protein COX15 n=1 Tax=Salpingoeca rosetta (strain ATCC 50818 / BSB-021) TaxID=946362 RepID=F2ULD5_SALR5|nr:uncharacterized protein PTSG_09569 [Salpingoeca rosetta]EGD77934.1 hypothetical protein PTSG_09569 [Salpingoeca rosetta]|eukprot:XP_004989997.1 hypothetical protein PTSG_09569 [Salpingoeca rosetta]